MKLATLGNPRAATVPPIVVDLTNTEVESHVPAHLLTDVDGTESAASSGFLNMFERDVDVEAFPTRMDTPNNNENDDESVSFQTRASEIHEVSDSEQEEAKFNLATRIVSVGLQNLDMIDLVEVWNVRRNLMKSVPNFTQRAYRTGIRQALDAVSLGEERGDDLSQIRGLPLFFWLTRALLSGTAQSGRPGSRGSHCQPEWTSFDVDSAKHRGGR